MKRFLPSLFLCIICLQINAQTGKSIFYKYSFVSGAAVLKQLSANTDSSSVLVAHLANKLILFDEKIKNKNIVYRKRFYPEDTVLHSEGIMDTLHHNLGIWKYYAPNGDLVKTINYVTGEWKLNQKYYPAHQLLRRVKYKADSIVKSIYGEAFYRKNLVFNPDQSGFTKLKKLDHSSYLIYGSAWTDQFSQQPTTFTISYDIKYDESHYFWNRVVFSINEKGEITHDSSLINFGVPQGLIRTSSRKHIQLFPIDSALKFVKNNLTEKSDSIDGVLSWNFWSEGRAAGFFTGEFRVDVSVKLNTDTTKYEQKLVKTAHYSVWSFDPLSWKLIEKKKMKEVFTYPEVGMNDSGLIDDD